MVAIFNWVVAILNQLNPITKRCVCLSEAVKMAAVQTDGRVLTRVKSLLYLSGVLSHCVRVLSLDPRRLRGNWSAAATLAQLTRYV